MAERGGRSRVATGTTGAAGTLAPAAPRTVRAAVARVASVLEHAGIREAKQEARDIVAALLDVPRFWPSLHGEAAFTPAQLALALRAAEKRSRGAPFAYAVGRAAFRHLTLDVDERVLIPRQETEQVVEVALGLPGLEGGVAIDVGTGSGAIACALASEGHFARVIATDISLDALAVARRNVELLAGAQRAPVELRHGALLAPVAGERARLVISNPPYIAFGEMVELPASVRDWEPGVALCSGENGMAATRELIAGAPALLEPGGWLVLEVDARRAALAAELAAADGRYEDVAVQLDLAGRERIVVARRRAEA